MSDDGTEETAPAKEQSPKRRAGRRAAKRFPKKGKKRSVAKTSKAPARRPYPRMTLEQALKIPSALKNNNGGNPWPPEDVANAVGLSVKNTDFFYLAAASRDFGFTEGGRDSQMISLTEPGRDVVYAANKDEEKVALTSALLKVEIFRKVLDYYKGANLPEMQYLGNTLSREFGLDPSLHEEFSRLFERTAPISVSAPALLQTSDDQMMVRRAASETIQGR
ncbi:hypothetical protein IVB27_35540 [Bradyrhizobium sp. 197]|uniref:hypothetical protein n=1 Tax=Bradyrhizobium sp. 197 TaxID=2782663 RepID=UPI001FFA0FF1|nr:hypothetical protein [Bradyrhizobium sp. 197]MCK1479915.1 hypothetical protein [Bradyrhizobium sp. 197]